MLGLSIPFFYLPQYKISEFYISILFRVYQELLMEILYMGQPGQHSHGPQLPK